MMALMKFIQHFPHISASLIALCPYMRLFQIYELDQFIFIEINHWVILFVGQPGNGMLTSCSKFSCTFYGIHSGLHFGEAEMENFVSKYWRIHTTPTLFSFIETSSVWAEF